MSCKPLFVQIVLRNDKFGIKFYKLLELIYHLIHAKSLA